jgi:hypothetical protein
MAWQHVPAAAADLPVPLADAVLDDASAWSDTNEELLLEAGHHSASDPDLDDANSTARSMTPTNIEAYAHEHTEAATTRPSRLVEKYFAAAGPRHPRQREHAAESANAPTHSTSAAPMPGIVGRGHAQQVQQAKQALRGEATSAQAPSASATAGRGRSAQDSQNAATSVSQDDKGLVAEKIAELNSEIALFQQETSALRRLKAEQEEGLPAPLSPFPPSPLPPDHLSPCYRSQALVCLALANVESMRVSCSHEGLPSPSRGV